MKENAMTLKTQSLEGVAVLPERFPGWNLEELVKHLEALHTEEVLL